MSTTPTIEERHTGPTVSEGQFWLYNRFDETCPPDWGNAAIERIQAVWAEEDACDEMPGSSIFWSRVFVTVVVLVAVAWVAMSQP